MCFIIVPYHTSEKLRLQGLMSLVLALFFCIFSYCSTASRTEWHLNDSYTLNVSTNPMTLSPEDFHSYMFTEFWLNASSTGQDPYAYLCFISSDGIAFILSICMTSLNMGDNPDLHTPMVWCANRDNPARGKFISLTLQMDGDLVLKGDADTSPAWRTDTANKEVIKMELVQFPINLVLYDTKNAVVWQSVDYLTDSLTALQTLRNGKKLVSWASPSDPSEGRYSLVVGPGSVTLYTSSVYGSSPLPYWNWDGPYQSDDTVVSVSALGFDLTSASNDTNNYNYDGNPIPPCQPNYELANKTFLRLESDGSLHLYVVAYQHWTDICSIPSSANCSLPLQCGSYGICSTGPNCASCPSAPYFTPLNTSNMAEGCSLTQPLLGCNDSRSNSSSLSIQMLGMHGNNYFANAYSPPISGISSEDICKGTCLGNCSCLAAFWHAHTSDCFHVNDWIGSLQGSLSVIDYRAYLKVQIPPSSDHTSQASHHFKLFIIIGCTLVIFFSTSIFIYCKLCRSRLKNGDDEEEMMLDTLLGLPTRYTYTELQALTHNFSRMLGKGGFGAVYEGMLDDGTKVAVKKLEGTRQGDKEFRSEVAIMAGTHHYHLLRLLGFCAQGAHRLLVYEYMENGSLDQWLFHCSSTTTDDSHTQRKHLTWDVRFKIAVGTAKGLAYLHDSCKERIIHLDVKPQNILLDDNFLPKVADFGLSRLVGREESNVMTTMRGTPGYLAPEWLKQSAIDEKCDVFSFGMLLLEIISGRKNLDQTQENPDRIYYPEWAFRQAQGAEYQSPTAHGSAELVAKLFTDAELREEEEEIQVRRMMKTAFLCVLEDPTLRPSMEQVVQMLEGLLDVMSVQFSSLLHGLLFVLTRNATAYDQMQKTVKAILASSTKVSTVSAATMSLEISAR